MKLLRRLGSALQAGLAPPADPRTSAAAERLPGSERLDQLTAALTELTEARKRSETRLTRLRERQAALWQGAAAALHAGDEAEARRSLVLRKADQPALAQAAAELSALAAEERRLREAWQRLAAELDAERVRREAAEAQRLAAEARAGAYETLATLDRAPIVDVDAELAERRALDARARADALAELAERRELPAWRDERSPGGRLDAVAWDEVEQELAALRGDFSGDQR
ncbi:MAG TPA: hypothetical protein VFD32_05815 [Dehalococcoidia bacterium]|nr:hypothetical protein [Dehalococcoidia bacterium]